jgi:hypothetical protein
MGPGAFGYGPPQQPVFISYSGEDSTVAAKVCRLLELQGIDCWIAPRNVEPGRDYGEQIISAIELAPAMVLILSAGANSSIFVPNELERAVSKGKPVFMFRLAQIQPSWDIGRLAARAQWFDGWIPPLEDRVYEMAGALRRMLGMPSIAGRTPRMAQARSGGPSVGVGLAAIGLAAAAAVALVGGLLFFAARGPETTASPSIAAASPTSSASPSPVASATPQLATGKTGFSYTAGFMETARGQHAEALLGDGRVLIAGGWSGTAALKTAELYDPKTGKFSATTGMMAHPRRNLTATALVDGRVLIVGGETGGDTSADFLNSAELFDPGSGTFSPTGSLIAGRELQTATLLPDGRVLITGGWNGEDAVNTAEVYDPKSGKFSATAPMTVKRERHAATVLGNGKVLITGGDDGSTSLKTAELYDPKGGGFTPTAGPMTAARSGQTATALSDGRVLIAGGDNGTSPLNSAELYDPATDKFATTGSMTAARRWHAATLLRNGRVLLTGGWKSSSAALSSAELYDPGSGTFSATSDMKIARCLQTAALLSDGRVLLTGGKDGPVSTATAELYQP